MKKQTRKQMLQQSGLAIVGTLLHQSLTAQQHDGRTVTIVYPDGYPLPKMLADRSKGRLFDHVGIPTSQVHEGEIYVSATKVFVTDPRFSDNSIEWIRPLADSPLPERLKTEPHFCFIVEDLEKEISGKQLIAGPFEYTPGYVRAAFFDEDGAIIEAKQYLRKGEFNEFPLLK